MRFVVEGLSFPHYPGFLGNRLLGILQPITTTEPNPAQLTKSRAGRVEQKIFQRWGDIGVYIGTVYPIELVVIMNNGGGSKYTHQYIVHTSI